jgi:hypothetical protein
MNIKQTFCNHDWEKQKIQLTNIAFIYVENSPTEELRTYTVAYLCKKCGRSKVKERYIEKSLTGEQRALLIKESVRYAEATGIK